MYQYQCDSCGNTFHTAMRSLFNNGQGVPCPHCGHRDREREESLMAEEIADFLEVTINKKPRRKQGKVEVRGYGDLPCRLCENDETCNKVNKIDCFTPCG